jgi:hypothetical protein
VFIILKQRIDTVKVETDVSIHNEEDVIGMETDAFCVPQGCEPEVNHIVRWFCGGGWCVLLWWFCTHGTAEIG